MSGCTDEREVVASTSPQQLHPLTPIATTLPLIAGIFFITLVAGGGSAWQVGVAGIPVGLVVCLVGFVVLVSYRYLLWRRFSYWFDGVGDLRIDSGVLYRNERKVQLSRLQAVDIERPLFARIFGLASLKIDVAGVGDSKVLLAYLANHEAIRLRVNLLNRARVAESGGTPGSGDVPAPIAETVIHTVAPADLLVSLILRTTTAGLFLLTGLIIFMTVTTSGAGGLLLLPFTGGIPLFMVVTEFMGLYGFTVASAHDGVRLRYGLLRTQAQTVPRGRVMAVDVIEPLLWRRKGWMRVRLTVAGVAGGDGDQQRNSIHSILLPVAHQDVVNEVLAHVMPGVEIWDLTLTPAPRKTRWRAPIQWSRLAYGFTEQVIVCRRGMVTRHLAVVPYARTQSVSIIQGPWQRRLGLSTMRIDIAPGPVNAEVLYFPAEQVIALADAQVERARVSRAGDWASGGAPD